MEPQGVDMSFIPFHEQIDDQDAKHSSPRPAHAPSLFLFFSLDNLKIVEPNQWPYSMRRRASTTDAESMGVSQSIPVRLRCWRCWSCCRFSPPIGAPSLTDQARRARRRRLVSTLTSFVSFVATMMTTTMMPSRSRLCAIQ